MDQINVPDRDFPYYRGRPVLITGPQWWFVMAMVAVGFAALILPLPPFRAGVGQFVPAILFPAIPLAGLAIVTPAHWTAIFRRVGIRDVGWMLFFGVLNAVVTIGVSALTMRLLGANANQAIAGLADRSASDLVLFFLKTAPQLLGEEVFTILPFLALLYFLAGRLQIGRVPAIVTAWIATAILFGLAHLPTYNWNLAQVLMLIGLARMVLSLAYIKTKNLWVSTGAHIVNDWGFFALTLLLNALKAARGA